MKSIPLPQKIQIEEKNDRFARIIIEPLYPGYGMTLGNTLRRVLLSSLPGAAVTGIRIQGAQHEFSSLPHIKEDLIDIILNIKLLRLRLLQEESGTMKISVKGEKKITGKDIEAPSTIEIVNPNDLIATLTDPAAALEIEFTVEHGLGYSPVESREKEKLSTGSISIDAIFTPIVKARFDVENVRVEQMTNYDRLTMEIETDGTMSAKEAFRQSIVILVDHFSFLFNSLFSQTSVPDPSETEKVNARSTPSSAETEEARSVSKEKTKKKLDKKDKQ